MEIRTVSYFLLLIWRGLDWLRDSNSEQDAPLIVGARVAESLGHLEVAWHARKAQLQGNTIILKTHKKKKNEITYRGGITVAARNCMDKRYYSMHTISRFWPAEQCTCHTRQQSVVIRNRPDFDRFRLAS